MAFFSGSSSTPSSSSSSSHHWKYDVFLSFRGEDNRNTFTDHLKSALLRAGIRTFFDEKDLETGEPIGPDLLKAIEESMCWIIVFSKNYASSTWCLDELAHIMECKKTSNRKLVPIFYDVDPADVRKQKGSFEEAFAKHHVRFKPESGKLKRWRDALIEAFTGHQVHESDKLKRWRDALTEATNLKGVDARNRPESLIVENIVTDILNKVRGKKLSVPVKTVGLDYRAREVIALLYDDEKVDVCIVGICGIGGVGKTTIAREVYNTIYQKFDGSCFLANIREASDDFQRVGLQKQLLSQVLNRRDESIYNVYQGVQAIENLLHRLRVLVVLDDVDDPQQLYNIIGNLQQFCPGSKIIITTRSKDLLKPLEGYRQYWVPELNTFESLELLSMKAFGWFQPPEEYMECSKMVIDYCKGIPLALEVLGSLLSRKKSVDAWKDKLKEFEEIMDVKIQNVLEISYRSLSEREQRVFLDIACFFIHKDQDYVISILDGCNFYPTNAIDTLIHMCLLKIVYRNKLAMHDLIQDMGRDIVRRECDEDPGRRSRVWRDEEPLHLLRDEMGTKTVEGLSVNLQGGSSELLGTTAFIEMKNLRLLKLDYIELEGAYKHISKRLRWLCWHGFPLESIPADLHLGTVVVLDMRYSSLRQFGRSMKMVKLKILNLSHSRQLTQTPNFGGLPSLQIMELEGCINLVEVDESIRLVTNLVILNLKYCIKLQNLPRSICEVALDKLDISGCRKLFQHSALALSESPSRPISDGWLVPISIKEIDISYCNLVDDMIPDDIQRLSYLKVLNMCGNNFSKLPAGISHLPQLKKLKLNDCQRLQSVMELPLSLISFKAKRCTKLSRINLINYDYRCRLEILLPPYSRWEADGLQPYSPGWDADGLQPYGPGWDADGLQPYGPGWDADGLKPYSFWDTNVGCQGKSFTVDDCPVLFEVDGMFKVEPIDDEMVKILETHGLPLQLGMAKVGLRMLNYLTDTETTISFLPAVFYAGGYNIYIRGSEIPNWYSHQSKGDSVSFTMPPLDKRDITGFIFCGVYAWDGIMAGLGLSSFILFKNESKNVQYRYCPPISFVSKEAEQDITWHGFWRFGKTNNYERARFMSLTEGGDRIQVKIYIEYHGISVNKCGVGLYLQEDSKINTAPFLPCVSSCYQKSFGTTFGKFSILKNFGWNISPSILEGLAECGVMKSPFIY